MKRFVSVLCSIVLVCLLALGCGAKVTPTPVPRSRPAEAPTSPEPATDRSSIFPLASEHDIQEAIVRFADAFCDVDTEPVLTALPDYLVTVDQEIEYVDGAILLVFRDGVTPDDVTQVLMYYWLLPLGLIPELGVVQAWIPDGRSPWDVANELDSHPALEGAGPDILRSFDGASPTASGESPMETTSSTSRALTLSSPAPAAPDASLSASSVLTVEVAAERFGALGAGQLSLTSGGFPTNTRRIMWPHFVMQTFAAHALVDEVGFKKPVTTRIAILDDGISDGKRRNPSPDLPASRCPTPNFVLTLKHTEAIPGFFGWTVKFKEVSTVRVMGASIDVSGMKSVGGHGHAVAHCAAADGTSGVLGTGRDALVRMIRIVTDKGGYPTAWERLALATALRDPNVRVFNLSLGTGSDEQPFGKTTRQANYVAAQADGAFYRPFLTKAGTADKIVVMAAGNEGINIEGTSSPASWAASKPGTRTAYSNEIAVAATDMDDKHQVETRAGFSQFGGRVTVSAPGGYGHYTYNVTNTITQKAGTSFAAPYVAGLAAEMFVVGEGLAKPPTASQVVHLIEATADDLVLSKPLPGTVKLTLAQQAAQKLAPAGTCPAVDVDPAVAGWQVLDHNAETAVNPTAAGDGWDAYFGYGRVNAWRAILALLNGGLPAKPAVQWRGNVAGPIADKDTLWYGFEIKTKVQNANAWIRDGTKCYQLVDIRHTSPFTSTLPAPVTAWKGVQKGQVPGGVTVKEGLATNGWFFATFSIRRKHLDDLDGQGITRPVLELYWPGAKPPASPFYRLPLNPTDMREGKVSGVSFSNWVFTVETTATEAPAPAPTPTLGSTAPPLAPGTLRLRFPWEPQLDPAAEMDQYSMLVGDMLFLGLTGYAVESMDVVPELAESWQVSEDGLRWSFRLRQDVYWIDSSFEPVRPVTAHDIVYALHRALDPATRSDNAHLLYVIKNAKMVGTLDEVSEADLRGVGVFAVDDHTVEFTLEEPAGYFAGLMALPVAKPLPREPIEALGEAWTEPENIWANGPFALSEWVHDDRLVLVANEVYWRFVAGSPATIEVKVVSGNSEAIVLYQRGDLDLTEVTRSGWREVMADSELAPDAQVFGRDYTYSYAFNTTKPPFDAPLVRQAFAQALDRQALVDIESDGLCSVAQTFAPPGVFGSAAGQGFGHEFDPQAAKQALSDAGYPNGSGFPEVSLACNVREQDQILGELAVRQWEDNLGVRVKLIAYEWRDYLQALEEGTLQIFRLSWSSVYPDQHDWVSTVFHSTKGSNRIKWSNAEFDTLTEQAGSELDSDRREQLYWQAEQILCVGETAIIPLFHDATMYLVKPWLHPIYSAFYGLRDVHRWQHDWVTGQMGGLPHVGG